MKLQKRWAQAVRQCGGKRTENQSKKNISEKFD